MVTKPYRKMQEIFEHPICIVPMHLPEVAAAPAPATPAPQLTYRKGPLLTAVEVFTIFWGSAWQQAPQSDLIAQVNQFFDFILTSALIDQLREYNVSGMKIGHGKRTGTTTLTAPRFGTSIQDSAIQQMLQQQIAAGTLPATTRNSLYFVFLPSGVQVDLGGSTSCQDFCGYHDSFGNNVYYAVMPYPGCQGCTSNFAVFDALTITSSHELCEAITDPVPGQGWYDDNHGEIGDICAWKTKVLGQYTVQQEWSNKANSCT